MASVPAHAPRRPTSFTVDGVGCAAWHYPGTNSACVVMGSGLAVTKEVGTDRFAAAFQDAGFSVVAFDFRHFGESEGTPRQIAPVKGQIEDFEAAVAFARTLPEVDPARIAIWGFSASGGHVFSVAARDRELAAAIAQAPLVDAFAIGPNAIRSQTKLAALRFAGRAIRDGLGQRLFGRDPLLLPLTGPPGTVTSLTTEDAQIGPEALNPGNQYPDWEQSVSAWSGFAIGLYRPGRRAQFVQCPLLVVSFEDDDVVLHEPAVAVAQAAPRGELVSLPGGHYAAFQEWHRGTVDEEVAFLRRHLLADADVDAGPDPAAELS